MRATERKWNARLVVLGIALTAAMLFGASRAAHADSIGCLFVLPTCTGCGPVELSPDPCPPPGGGELFAINVCLSTFGGTGPTATPGIGDISVDTSMTPPNPPTVTVTAHYGVAGTAGADVQTTGFPSTSPTGHAVVWIGPSVAVLGGLHVGIADQQSGCPE